MSQAHRKGFSFIEVLVAISLTGLLVAACSTLLLGYQRTLQGLEEGSYLNRRADGIQLFLQYLLNESSSEDPAIAWTRPPRFEQKALHFSIDRPPPFFVLEKILPEPIEAWLWMDEDQGLSLIWHTQAKPEELYRSPVTAQVDALEYAYFSEVDKDYVYHDSTEPATEFEQMPERIRLRFSSAEPAITRELFPRQAHRNGLIY